MAAEPHIEHPGSRTPYLIPVGAPHQEQVIELRDLVRTCWRSRWLILGMTLALGLIGTGLAFWLTPIYRGEVVLSAAPTMNPENSSLSSSLAGQLGGLSSLVGLKTTGPDITEEAIATLQSRSFTQSFVERHNLLPILFASDWDAANSKWNTDDVPTLGDAFKLFDKHIREVIEDSKTGLVTLRVDWRDRELAAQWANQMVADLNQQLRERAIKDADKGIQYLDAELAKTSVLDIQLAIDGLLSNELHTIMLANVNEEYAFRVIDPAIVSDEDDFVWPMRLVLIAGGLLLGMIIGVLAAFLREGSREPAAAHR